MKKAKIILVFLMCCILCACGGQASPIEDFEFEFSNGEVIITEYIGTEREIKIPDKIEGRPVTVIGESAFEDYDLESVVIPDSVVKIEENAFYACECLVNVTLSENLKVIEDHAFAHCVSLATIRLPDGLKELGGFVFDGCKKLSQLDLPDNVELNAFSPVDGHTLVFVNEGSWTWEQIQEGAVQFGQMKVLRNP